MPTYHNTLSPELAKIASELYPYRANTKMLNSVQMQHDPQFLVFAFNQIVKDTGVYLGRNEKIVLDKIIDMQSKNDRNISKDLYELTNHCNFYWKLYDDCVQICKKHGFTRVSNFEPVPLPLMPTTTKELLALLTVKEIKSILKQCKLAISGKRAELEKRVQANIDFQDLQLVADEKYQQNLADYEVKVIIQKYQYLASFVKFRSRFLMRLTNYDDQIYKQFYVSFKLREDIEKQQIMGKELDGTGFTNVVVNEKICKNLPLFPCSLSYLRLEIRR